MRLVTGHSIAVDGERAYSGHRIRPFEMACGVNFVTAYSNLTIKLNISNHPVLSLSA